MQILYQLIPLKNKKGVSTAVEKQYFIQNGTDTNKKEIPCNASQKVFVPFVRFIFLRTQIAMGYFSYWDVFC